MTDISSNIAHEMKSVEYNISPLFYVQSSTPSDLHVAVIIHRTGPVRTVCRINICKYVLNNVVL